MIASQGRGQTAGDRDGAAGSGAGTRRLLACGIVGPVLFIATFLVEGMTRPGYDSLTQPISALEGGPLGWIQQVNFLVFGLLLVGFAAGLRQALGRGRIALWAPLLEGLVALGLIGDGLWTHDPLHTGFDILTFTAAMGVCLVLAGRFLADDRWRGWATYSIGTAVVLVLCLVAFGMALRQHGDAGGFERLAVLVRSLWTVLLVGRLLQGRGVAPPDAVPGRPTDQARSD